MTAETAQGQQLPNGVMFNAYPDSIGERLGDTLEVLGKPEFADAFSLFYILPTFFHSDLDRGFSVIDYGINEELVFPGDLEEAGRLELKFKFDLVLNHLSVGSPQFKDLLEKGDRSPYRDFFIDWNQFWESQGDLGPDGHVVPDPQHLDKLFMRKPDLPILKVRFPDGSERPYWNTFYQEVSYEPLSAEELQTVEGMTPEASRTIATDINALLEANESPAKLDLGKLNGYRADVLSLIEGKRRYLGQMDLNAQSETVWAFYEETLQRLKGYGARLIRLDAFAYLHKQVGEANFFNKPGTWEYLERLKELAARHDLVLLPEIHAEYGSGMHREVAAQGFPVYDFFLPGLLIDALDRGTNEALLRWIGELMESGIRTVNMLGCHDGIPVLDLRGKEVDGVYREGLLSDEQIETVMENIIDRGGRIKNLYGADGKKIAYYQVNATYYSALGEDDRKMLLARAIQLFMPGIPQVWYLDLFLGRNDHDAADRGGTAGHKEINRTTLSQADIERGLRNPAVLNQLDLLRLRNTHPAFLGELEIHPSPDHELMLTWRSPDGEATLEADLRSCELGITHARTGARATRMSFGDGQ